MFDEFLGPGHLTRSNVRGLPQGVVQRLAAGKRRGILRRGSGRGRGLVGTGSRHRAEVIVGVDLPNYSLVCGRPNILNKDV